MCEKQRVMRGSTRFRRRACVTFVVMATAVAACNPGPDRTGPRVQDPSAASDSGASAESSPKAAETNVIWICLDALRAKNMSVYGYDRATTPVMERMAKMGTVFEKHFAQAPATVSSVPSFLTGRYFPVSCMSQGSWREMFRVPPDDEKFLQEILEEAGYQTVLVNAHAWIGPDSRLYKSFREVHSLTPDETNRGYAKFDELNEVALPWLEQHNDQPFFMYIHALDTHFPHVLAAPYDRWLDKKYSGTSIDTQSGMARDFKNGKYTEEDREYLRGLYDGDLLFADEQIGRILETLENIGELNNTIIVIASDHGEALGEDGKRVGHGYADGDEILHTPFLLMGPGVPKDKRIAQLTQNVDIVPTLLALLDVENSGASFDGKSLVPLFEDNPPQALHEFIFFKAGSYDEPNFFGLHNGEYRYELNRKSKAEHLWLAPDVFGQRSDDQRENAAEVLESARRFLAEFILPQEDKYSALPRVATHAFNEAIPSTANPRSAYAVSDEAAWTDNKWLLIKSTIQSAHFQEDAPPISFRIEVPNGPYRIQIEIMSKERHHFGHPASSFLLKAEDDSEFHLVSSTGGDGWALADVGEYEIQDHYFDVVLDEGDPEHWAIARGFRFIPLLGHIDAEDSEAVQRRREQLEALGYLN